MRTKALKAYGESKDQAIVAWTYLLLAIYVGLLYIPLILKGGIIVDDWGDIHPTMSCRSFYECYSSWFPLFSNRPLAPLPITGMTMVFGTHFSCYLLVNSLVFLFALYLIFRIVKNVAGDYAAFIFFYLSSAPIISLPIVASPINQSTATFALLYWAISLACLQQYCEKRLIRYYLLTYIFLFFGLLTYEVILPLITITAFFPLILKNRQTSSWRNFGALYLLPIFLILSLILIWQKILAPNIFDVDYSRFSPSSRSLYASVYSWFSVFTIQIPILFYKLKGLVSWSAILSGALLVIGISFTYLFNKNSTNSKSPRVIFFYTCTLCLISSSAVFILSGTVAESGGYLARGLSSTWISLILFLSSIAGLIRIRILRIALLIILLVFGFFTTLSFITQRNGYIESWRIQNIILNDIVELSDKVQIPPNATVIGIVPQFIERNYNDEIVFSQPWDFGSALSIATDNHIANGYPIDPSYSKLKGLSLSENGVKGTNWGGSDWTNLWIYRYDSEISSGTITPTRNKNEFKDYLLSIGYLEDFDGNSLVRPGKPILFSQKIVDGEKYIKDGWSSQESWGRWTSGQKSQIRVPMPTEHVKILRLKANAFVTENHPILKIGISINSGPVKLFEITQSKNLDLEIPIPARSTTTPYATIDFDIKNPASPKDLGMGSDDRKLGIGVKELTFY